MPRQSITYHFKTSNADSEHFVDDSLLVVVVPTLEALQAKIPEQLFVTIAKKIKRTSQHVSTGYRQLISTHGYLTHSEVFVVIEQEIHHRKLGDELVHLARKEKISTLFVDLYDSQQKEADEKTIQHLAEGMNLANFERINYAQQANEFFFVKEITINIAETKALNEAIHLAEVYSEGVCLARDLTNLPGNYLTPVKLANEVQSICEPFHFLKCEILDEQQIENAGMGGLLAVGKASVNPPRMITVHYKGDEQSSECWGLIGKGITFDTGGISLKRSDNMAEMICDMAGAASIVGTIQSIARLQPKCNIVFVIAAAENMPAGNAYKPGDIVTTLSGKTIEVLNTDAEGRVVLADAITYAKQQGATKLIDLATLTGAILVSLADVATGAVTNDQSLMSEILEVSEMTDERIWQLPVYSEYKEMIKSKVADVKNTGGRYAGSITGGLFIGTFAENTPWVHLDIAGTAFLEQRRGINPKGGTGVMVRTLIQLLLKQQKETAKN